MKVSSAFRELRIGHPDLKMIFILSLAVKACNDILGPERVVPSAPVFGEFPFLRLSLRPKVHELHKLNEDKPL